MFARQFMSFVVTKASFCLQRVSREMLQGLGSRVSDLGCMGLGSGGGCYQILKVAPFASSWVGFRWLFLGGC